MSYVEFFEMCEISPGVQCPHRLTYWTKGIVYCTCGTCLYLTEKTRKKIRDRFDTLSIPHNVIKKGPLHGGRHGNTERQRIYHSAHTAAKKANKRGYDTLLKRFQNCPICRESQLAIRCYEAFGAHYDEISKEDRTYVCTAEEHRTRQNSWVLILNSQGTNGPMKQREDYADAIRIKERYGRTKNPSQQTSTAKSKSTVLKIQWRSRTSWPENWMEIVSSYHLIKFIFVMVAIIRKMVAASSWDEQWTLWFLFRPQTMAIPLQPTGCKTYTTPAHIPHFRNTWIFSRGSRLESSSQLWVFVSW